MKFVVYIALSLLTMYITKQLDNSMDTYYSTITYPHVYDVFHSALPNFHKYEYILNIYCLILVSIHYNNYNNYNNHNKHNKNNT